MKEEIQDDPFIQKHLAIIKEKIKMIKEETAEYVPYGKEWQKEMKKFPKDALIMMLAGEFQKVRQYEEQFKQSSPIGVEQRGINLTNMLKVKTELAIKEGSPYHETAEARTMAFNHGWEACQEYYNIPKTAAPIAGSQWASPRPIDECIDKKAMEAGVMCGYKREGEVCHVCGKGGEKSKDNELQVLRQWKKVAMDVMPPMQEIGQELGVKLGESIHDKILPAIKKLKAAAAPKADELLETVKIALSYRDFGVLNEYLVKIGENKIEVPTRQADEVKSKEDCLRKAFERHKKEVLPDNWWCDWETCEKDGTDAMVYEAMEEYANQFKSQANPIKNKKHDS